MPKTNLAYSLNLNVKRKELTNQNTSPIKKIEPKKFPKIKPAFYIFLIMVASVVVSFYLTYLVKGSELNFKINSAKQQYEIQKSETVRLQSLLETNCLNAVEIEKYAKLKLRMRKQNSSQIYYINRQKNDLKRLNRNKGKNLKKDKNILSSVKNYFKTLSK